MTVDICSAGFLPVTICCRFENSVVLYDLDLRSFCFKIRCQLYVWVFLWSICSELMGLNGTRDRWFFQLRWLRPLRWQPGHDVTARLVCVLVLPQLDYCNAVLAGLPVTTLTPLQRVLHAATRLVLYWTYARKTMWRPFFGNCTGYKRHDR